MSRSGYSEDYDGDVPPQLYRGAVDQATFGRRGQRFLKDLLAALDAMTEKRLVAGALVSDGTAPLHDEYGDEVGKVPAGCCAIGALGIARNIDLTGVHPDNAPLVGQTFDIAECLAREVVYMNDEHYGLSSEEQRWTKMRAWVASQIKTASGPRNNS